MAETLVHNGTVGAGRTAPSASIRVYALMKRAQGHDSPVNMLRPMLPNKQKTEQDLLPRSFFIYYLLLTLASPDPTKPRRWPVAASLQNTLHSAPSLLSTNAQRVTRCTIAVHHCAVHARLCRCTIVHDTHCSREVSACCAMWSANNLGHTH